MIRVPTDPYEAADHLIAHDPWLRALVHRVLRATMSDSGWLDELAETIREATSHAEAMKAYSANNRAPIFDPTAYAQWRDAAPKISPRAEKFTKLSRGEAGALRLLATLSSTRLPWSVHDVLALDTRSMLIAAEWLHLIWADLPEWLHDANSVAWPDR